MGEPRRLFPGDSERVDCPTCGKFLRRTHYSDPSDARRLAAFHNAAEHEPYRHAMIAMQLALDLTACRALLQREPVHPSRLDRERLATLRAEGLKI